MIFCKDLNSTRPKSITGYWILWFFLSPAIRGISEVGLRSLLTFYRTLMFRRIICLQNIQIAAELLIWLVARVIINSFAKYFTEDLYEISQPRSQLSEISYWLGLRKIREFNNLLLCIYPCKIGSLFIWLVRATMHSYSSLIDQSGCYYL